MCGNRIHDELKGQIFPALVVTKLGSEMEHYQLEQEIIKLVRTNGAVASLRNVVIVHRLPKTDQVKHRKLMRSITDGTEYQIPSTIDDATISELIETLTKNMFRIYKKNKIMSYYEISTLEEYFKHYKKISKRTKKVLG
jgi:propionyl-CoA synthetase